MTDQERHVLDPECDARLQEFNSIFSYIFDSNRRVCEAVSVGDFRCSLEQQKRQARAKGYEDVACEECGNFTLVQNGTNLKCHTCGSEQAYPSDFDKDAKH